MFENCTLKYIKNFLTDENYAVRITYPAIDGISATSDVPLRIGNTDYQNILKWVEEGNKIEEAD